MTISVLSSLLLLLASSFAIVIYMAEQLTDYLFLHRFSCLIVCILAIVTFLFDYFRIYDEDGIPVGGYLNRPPIDSKVKTFLFSECEEFFRIAYVTMFTWNPAIIKESEKEGNLLIISKVVLMIRFISAVWIIARGMDKYSIAVQKYGRNKQCGNFKN